jgi:D-xylose transport system substrate-binding protein
VNTFPRGVAVLAAALCVAVGPVSCGQNSGSGNTPGKDSLAIGLLLPDNQTARYEQFDRPLIQKRIKELCGDCTLEYANAGGDAATQQQQVAAMITKGIEVLILDPVNSKSLSSSVRAAHAEDVPVIAYDRLAEGPISAYVSFDNEQIGRIQGEALLEAVGDKADEGQIVWISGFSDNPNWAMRSRAARAVLDGRVQIGRVYGIDSLSPGEAHTKMSEAIAALGADRIVGVYAANDSIASGAISALKAAKVTPLPPVTGQDADLTAVQRIITGDQYMSVYKPYKPEADAAAEIAVALGRDESLDDIAHDRVNSPTTKDIPAVLLTPTSLTVDNIKDTVVKDGMHTVEQICTPKFMSACEKAGLVT